MIECIEASDQLAITLAHFKQHLRMEHEDQDLNLPPKGEDVYLEDLIRTATDIVEHYTQRSLLHKVWRLQHQHDAKGGNLHTFELPYPPLLKIIEVRDLSLRTVDQNPPLIKRYMLTPNGTVPIMSIWSQYVEVTYQAGYGSTSAHIPPALRQAITCIAAELYEHRIDHTVEITGSLKTMLMPYRIISSL